MFLRSISYAFILLLSLMPLTPAAAQSDASEERVNAFYNNVMTALAAQPRPSFSIEAQALIAFSVADDGSIDTITVAQSSGSEPLDSAAVELVQNAAPFPEPPEGANRDLTITIKSVRPVLGFGNLDRLRE